MKILEIKRYPIYNVCKIKVARYQDNRGYFSETWRQSTAKKTDDLPIRLQIPEFKQSNEVYSKKGTFRGLHTNTINPQGKLIRCVFGRLIDFVVDVNPESETFRKAVLVDLKPDFSNDYTEWLWVPRGLAHGTLLTEESMVEYYCSEEWVAEGDKSYSVFSEDIDWSIADKELWAEAQEELLSPEINISEKDRTAGDFIDKTVELSKDEKLNQYFQKYER
jgi:dTDP-4-dehydrorhamnose 3,5-epimerase